MEPKFQSSFIPKGPIAQTAGIPATAKRTHSLFGLISMTIFVASIVGAIGVSGYKFYLGEEIEKMGHDLEAAQAALASEDIKDLVRLDDRLSATDDLVNSHVVLSPLFDLLEQSTVRSVRFTDFSYSTTPAGLALNLKGQATSYAAVAEQAAVFKTVNTFKDQHFADFALDERGNVAFAFTATVDPNLVSYAKTVKNVLPPSATPAATTTPAATSTSPRSTPVATSSLPII